MKKKSFTTGRGKPNPPANLPIECELPRRSKVRDSAESILQELTPRAGLARRCCRLNLQIRVCVLAALAAITAGLAQADDGLLSIATLLDGRIEISGLPSEGHSLGPVTFRTPAIAGYVRSIGSPRTSKGQGLILAQSIFLDVVGSIWTSLDGLRSHANAALAEIDDPDGGPASLALANLTVGARPGSRFESALALQDGETSLASIDELVVLYSGAADRESQNSSGMADSNGVHAAAGSMLEIVAREIRLAGAAASNVAEPEGGDAWSNASVSIDAVLAISNPGSTPEGSFGLLISIDDRPSVQVSGDFELGADRSLQAGIQFSKPNLSMNHADDGPAENTMNKGIQFLTGVSNRLAMIGNNEGAARDLGKTIEDFRRFQRTVSGEFSLSL